MPKFADGHPFDRKISRTKLVEALGDQQAFGKLYIEMIQRAIDMYAKSHRASSHSSCAGAWHRWTCTFYCEPTRSSTLIPPGTDLWVRSGDVGGLLGIPVGLELHRVHRCAVQKREEGVRAEGEPNSGWLDVAVAGDR